jgi:hypothetical protein
LKVNINLGRPAFGLHIQVRRLDCEVGVELAFSRSKVGEQLVEFT